MDLARSVSCTFIPKCVLLLAVAITGVRGNPVGMRRPPKYTSPMTLSEFAAEKRSRTFEALLSGLPPPEGEFSDSIFKEGKDKSQPQMGATRYEPDAVVFEFIYPDPLGAPSLLSVRLEAPERIVFMPIPPWVVESIWQGEVAGSYHFESEARKLLEDFMKGLEPEPNAQSFGVKPTVGRW